MPWSNPSQISKVLEIVLRENPYKILDLGCGMGIYGFLCRIFLEQIDLFNFIEKRIDKNIWKRKIDCVEGFEKYITPVHLWSYNDVIIDNIESAILKFNSKSYDMVLFLDVIEHFDKDTGMWILKEAFRVGRQVIVTTPKEFFAQVVEENPLENHRSHWSKQDFMTFGKVEFFDHPESLIALISG